MPRDQSEREEQHPLNFGDLKTGHELMHVWPVPIIVHRGLYPVDANSRDGNRKPMDTEVLFISQSVGTNTQESSSAR